MSLSDSVQNLLSQVIPYPLFRILAGFSNLIYHLVGSANDPASWTSTLLPPLITFFLAYFALMIAYRTLKSMIALAWFGIKWGAILGALIAIWAWWTENTDSIYSVGQIPSSGLFDQLTKWNHLVAGPALSTIYTQMQPYLSNPSSSSSSESAPRRKTPLYRSRSFRSSSSFSTTQGEMHNQGFGAFESYFGETHQDIPQQQPPNVEEGGGIDLAKLLRTIVDQGRKHGLDPTAALNAAGNIQQELKKLLQQDPTFVPPTTDEFPSTARYSTRANTKSKAKVEVEENETTQGFLYSVTRFFQSLTTDQSQLPPSFSSTKTSSTKRSRNR